MAYPRSPHEKVGGIVYFGRMIDKIRLHAKGDLHPDLQENLGSGFDETCCKFFHVDYAALADKVRSGVNDEEAMTWCYVNGRKPDEEDIRVWNDFMRKRGWNDPVAEALERRKRESGFQARSEIQTMFDYIDADEGRPIRVRD